MTEQPDPASFDIDSMPILVRRRIEAMVLGPVVRAFQEEFGSERTAAVVQRVIEHIAEEQGRAFAERVGGSDISTYVANKGAWTAGNALEMDILRLDRDKYDYNVTRCRYAEMYRQLGMADLGFIFSCGRDFAFPKGYNPRMKLTRTQTIMQGDPVCDFRYRVTVEDEMRGLQQNSRSKR